MLNDFKKTAFKYDHERKAQYVAEVKEVGKYKGEPCTYIVTREIFHTIGRFRAMLPLLIAEYGSRLEIKKNVKGKYIYITQEQAKLV